jgi:uncharacterized alkaline shock family protein YloU
MFIAISTTQTANQWSLNAAQNFINSLAKTDTAKIIAIRLVVLLLGIFLIAVALFTMFGNLEKRRTERTVVLESPLGEIMVSLGAIEDFSRVVKNQVKGVKDIKGKVISTRKGMKVTARVTLYSDRSVSEVTQEVQEAIVKYIQYTLGIEAPIKPTVIVSKIVFKSKEDEK